MVEISNARYEQLIRAETTLDSVKRICKTLPSYKLDDALKALLTDESEVKTDVK